MAIINFKKLAILAPLGLSTLHQTLAAPARADVTHVSGKKLQKMNYPDPGIFVCSKAHWRGNCSYINFERTDYHHCLGVNLLGGYTSFGPDKGVIVDIFSGEDCQNPAKLNIIYPGSHNLIAEGVNGTASSHLVLSVRSYDGVYLKNTTGGT